MKKEKTINDWLDYKAGESDMNDDSIGENALI